jgi:hypothetical protein
MKLDAASRNSQEEGEKSSKRVVLALMKLDLLKIKIKKENEKAAIEHKA